MNLIQPTENGLSTRNRAKNTKNKRRNRAETEKKVHRKESEVGTVEETEEYSQTSHQKEPENVGATPRKQKEKVVKR